MSNLIFLDTETTGLDPIDHGVWEIAWAPEVGPVRSFFVDHHPDTADPKALELNGYHSRFKQAEVDTDAEVALRDIHLAGATIVASNPSFDTQFLYERWSQQPWHHRKVDIATYAMPFLQASRPVGLAQVARALGVEQPDHTAAQDVLVLRTCYLKLRDIYYRSDILSG
jgi:DNA polymerase III alpha subunit (gram-positive type)